MHCSTSLHTAGQLQYHWIITPPSSPPQHPPVRPSSRPQTSPTLQHTVSVSCAHTHRYTRFTYSSELVLPCQPLQQTELPQPRPARPELNRRGCILITSHIAWILLALGAANPKFTISIGPFVACYLLLPLPWSASYLEPEELFCCLSPRIAIQFPAGRPHNQTRTLDSRPWTMP